MSCEVSGGIIILMLIEAVLKMNNSNLEFTQVEN